MMIGILLTSSPDHQNSQTVCALSEAFLLAHNQVSLFLMDDGVYHVVRTRSDQIARALEALLQKKMKIVLCTQSAEKRGLSEESCLSGVGWFSQAELSKIISQSDRFLSFGD